jgi:hypothetical protein
MVEEQVVDGILKSNILRKGIRRIGGPQPFRPFPELRHPALCLHIFPGLGKPRAVNPKPCIVVLRAEREMDTLGRAGDAAPSATTATGRANRTFQSRTPSLPLFPTHPARIRLQHYHKSRFSFSASISRALLFRFLPFHKIPDGGLQ